MHLSESKHKKIKLTINNITSEEKALNNSKNFITADVIEFRESV
jgi:hypothetical protein